MEKLAVLYANWGRNAEAEALYREIVETRKRVLGDDHPDTLTAMGFLASAFQVQGRYAEAERLFRETVESCNRVLGEEHPATLEITNGLAWLLLTRDPPEDRDPQRALELALGVAERTRYGDPNALDTLSLAYHLSGDTAMAIENQKKAIALVPEGHPMRAGLEQTLAQYEAALAGSGGASIGR